MDKAGFSTVLKPSKVLDQKGKHQVGAITSGVKTTPICCMNTAGAFELPILLYKHKRMTDDLKLRGPKTSYRIFQKMDGL